MPHSIIAVNLGAIKPVDTTGFDAHLTAEPGRDCYPNGNGGGHQVVQILYFVCPKRTSKNWRPLGEKSSNAHPSILKILKRKKKYEMTLERSEKWMVRIYGGWSCILSHLMTMRTRLLMVGVCHSFYAMLQWGKESNFCIRFLLMHKNVCQNHYV